MTVMVRQGKSRWMIAGILIISMLSVYGYRVSQHRADVDEASKTACKEQSEQKVKSGLPMWESLSRHLITIQR